jgi:hypothetical protein
MVGNPRPTSCSNTRVGARDGRHKAPPDDDDTDSATSRRSSSCRYSQGEISQSVGAEIAGISRAEFVDELSRRRIAVVQVTPEELQEEIDRE